ncbi:unnamed protein product [Camellia sinensis]
MGYVLKSENMKKFFDYIQLPNFNVAANAIETFKKGHGIPNSIIKEVGNVAHKFFSLPYEEKLKIKISPTTGYRGYQRIGENITKGIPDMHEAIDVCFA